MARLIYAMLASLDGYVEDADGGFAWATPSEEVHAYANEIGASVDPDAVRAWVAAADRDVAIAGPEIAARAIAAGLVGEVHVIVAPVVVGGGKRLFPAGSRLDLRLVEQRGFADGFVALRYAVRAGSPVSRFVADDPAAVEIDTSTPGVEASARVRSLRGAFKGSRATEEDDRLFLEEKHR